MSFPPRFPQDLAARAFVSGSELAWPKHVCAAVIDWLATHGYAVLGTELWIIREKEIQPWYKLAGRPAFYGNDCSRKQDEDWESFVRRAAEAAIAAVKNFPAPGESVEEPVDSIHFCIVWADKQEYSRLEEERN